MTLLHSSALDASALSAIRFYQRRLSPHKGFRCAHAALYGGKSCSAAVAQLIGEQGLMGSGAAIGARFQACRSAFDQLSLGQSLVPSPQATGGTRVRGVCCCGPLPIPFRCG